MIDKKFTDEEIIKALEDYIKENEFEYFHSNMVGEYPLIRKFLDLINRQKAEIERLKECPKCVYEYDGEMTEYCVQGPCPNFKTVEQIKAEAYKEFAERLKQHKRKMRGFDLNEEFWDYAVLVENIDNLLKEMVDDDNE